MEDEKPTEPSTGRSAALGRILEDSLKEIYVFDAGSLRFLLVSRGGRKNLGYAMDELELLTPVDIEPEFTHTSFAELLAPLHSGERSNLVFETEHERKDGSTYGVEVHLQSADFDGTPCFVALVLDVTERQASAKRALETGERLAAVLNTAADAIVTIDDTGTIRDANPATERMFGYPLEELLGSNVSILMPSPYREEHDRYIGRYLETGEARIIGVGREVVARHRSGREFPVDLAVGRVDHLGLFTGVIRDISERRELQSHLLSIAAEEQRWVGHELHDGLGQELSGLTMMADTLVTLVEGGRMPSTRMVRDLARGLRSANDQVRALARGLSPIEVDTKGLIAALAGLGRQIERRTGIEWQLDAPEDIPIGDRSVCGHLFRIAQEASNNAIRHADPTYVRFTITVDDRFVTLAIHDDGCGISESASQSEGLGMRIMRYRAGIIGGRLKVESSSGAGTSVVCTVPVDAA